MICVFLGISLLPLIIYTLSSGASSAMGTDRSVAMGEIYALKIAQLFIPTDSHGIGIIQKLINGYSQMPLNNENITAYNSVIAGVGFIGALLLCLNHKYVSKNHDYSKLFSILILCSVLYATIGGFSSLMFLVFRFIRCFNRISIFIMFLSLYVFLYFAQNSLLSLKTAKPVLRYSGIGILAFIVGIGLLDEIPTRNKYAAAFDSNLIGIESMENYYKEVESVIQPNDMVIQLPYIGYPEGGQVASILPDSYCLDYLTSSTIKWSFGSVKGSDSDKYYKYAASLSPEEMLKVIIPSGFRGVQIDIRGYEEEVSQDLIRQFTELVGSDPIVSEDGVKYFFNLYPYIENGYYYPYSKQAISVRNALVRVALARNVRIITEKCIETITPLETGFILNQNTDNYYFDKVILATGSKSAPKTGSDGIGYLLAKQLGHPIITPNPSLVQLISNEPFCKDWAGIRAEALVSLWINNQKIKEERGEIQLTKSGASGICVYNVSRYVKAAIKNSQTVSLHIRFLPDCQNVLSFFEQRTEELKNACLDVFLENFLPYKLAFVLIKQANLNKTKTWNSLTSKETFIRTGP